MAWQYTLCDLASDTQLADITAVCQTKQISPRLNRPLSITVTGAGDTAEFRNTDFDGNPNLMVGYRTIKAFQDGVLRGNTIVWNIAPSGDANTQTIQVIGMDPMVQLVKRPVRASGNLADPIWPSPITGAQIVIDILDDTINTNPLLGEGDGAQPLWFTYALMSPTDSTVDLGSQLSDWPMTISDLISLLTDTGVFDLVLVPVDTSTGAPAGTLGSLFASDSWGSDISGTVSFDYATGLNNVSAIRRTFDMDEICNKLYYYLGPKIDLTHWQSNITGTEITPVDLSFWEGLQLASRAIYGTYMDVKIYDSTELESGSRQLWHRLWEEEVAVRVNPREMVYVTPQAYESGGFRPFIDYNIGDVVGINAADIVGPAISGAMQRIYGFDVSQDKDGVERVAELLTTADTGSIGVGG